MNFNMTRTQWTIISHMHRMPVLLIMYIHPYKNSEYVIGRYCKLHKTIGRSLPSTSSVQNQSNPRTFDPTQHGLNKDDWTRNTICKEIEDYLHKSLINSMCYEVKIWHYVSMCHLEHITRRVCHSNQCLAWASLSLSTSSRNVATLD